MSPPVLVGKLEVEFVPGSGTYVDLSLRCLSMEINRPRPSEDGSPSATTLTVVLDNAPDATGFCPLTPNSPAAAYHPNLDRDRLVKASVVVNGAITYLRFFGWSDTWVPDAGDGNPDNSTVTLTASCILSRYARAKFLSDFGEGMSRLSLSDYWPYDEESDAAFVRGLAADLTVPNGVVVPPQGGSGSLAFSKPDAGILVDGSAEFARGDGSTASASPVILHQLRAGLVIRRVSAWIRLSVDPAGATDDAFGLYKADGTLVWRLVVGLTAGAVTWQIIDVNNAIVMQWNSLVPRDDAWHWISVFPFVSGGLDAIAIAVRDKAIPDRFVGQSFFSASDPKAGDYLVVGGRMAPTRKGKQSNTLQGSVAGVQVIYTNLNDTFSDRAAAGTAYRAFDRAAMLIAASAALDAPVGGGFGGSDLDDTPVLLTGAAATLLDAWAEHALTIGGILSTLPDGRRRLAVASAARPTTVAITLDANADLHLPAGGWVGVLDERPTRVTASAPVGSVTVIDTVTEAATTVRLDGPTLQTSAGSLAVARNAAAWVMAPRLARLSSFGLDAGLTSTDRTVELMALRPGDRVRVSGLPSAYTGVTYVDAYASGWKETYEANGRTAAWVFDTDPADDPPEAVFDDAEYGRFAMEASTVTGGTCVGTTGTGTVIITTSTPLTTTGGEFILDLDWNGERITVSGVGGGTSPQTATVTVRGVAPSVARAHVAGETVNLWHAATFAR